MLQIAEAHNPTTALSPPITPATAIIGTTRSVHSRAVSAGTVSSAMASSVPTAGTAVTIVTVTAHEHRRIEQPGPVAERRGGTADRTR